MKYYLQKKYLMWYKVNEFIREGLNISQISRKLELDRATVRRYLHLSEEDFLTSAYYNRNRLSKLSVYKEFIVEQLEFCNELSSSQIYDRLREHYIDLPSIHRNTVNNYVNKIREEYNIPKQNSVRSCIKLLESDYGESAQVDFGERWMYDKSKRSVKVYFFVMVLCASRYKYIYYQRTPFTSLSAIYAHELAFQYFGGIPKKIIYDQDKVFISNENLGDYILTDKFRSFVSKYHFQTIFCRKSDPQSKGKVENVVKYVKNNFLRGRAFTDIEELNKQGLSWLSRTANGLTHSGTQRIPSAVFEQERNSLISYTGTPELVAEVIKEYKVRKDNTINYRSNFYSLPRDTYKGADTTVHVVISGDKLIIYSKETGKTITTHTISQQRGKTISNAQHRKRDTSTITSLESDILTYLSNREEVKIYLSELSMKTDRYYRDNLRNLSHHMRDYTPKIIVNEIISQVNGNIYNTNYLVNALKRTKTDSDIDYTQVTLSNITKKDLTPEKSNINTYKNIIGC